MNSLDILARSNTDASVALNTFGEYTLLTILIPVMVFLIALFLLIALFILSSMSDKLTDIRDLLIDEREINESLADSDEIKDGASKLELKRASLTLAQKVVRQKANTRSIFIWGAIIAIPILSIVLIWIINSI